MLVVAKATRSNVLLIGRGVWVPAFAWPAPGRRRCVERASRPSPFLQQVLFQDRHLELERAVIILVVDEQHADELLADIDLGGISFFGRGTTRIFGLPNTRLR